MFERCSSFLRFRTERCVLEAKTCESHSGALRTLVEDLNLRRIKPQDLPQPFLHGDITPAEWLREPHTTGAQSKFGNYGREPPLLGSSSRFHRIEPSPYFNVVQTRVCAKDLWLCQKKRVRLLDMKKEPSRHCKASSRILPARIVS